MLMKDDGAGNSQTKYFVATKDQQLGPWTIAQILANVQSRALVPSDYLYDEAVGDWVALMAHPALADALKGLRPDGSPAQPANAGAGSPAPQSSLQVDQPLGKRMAQRLGGGHAASPDLASRPPEQSEWYVLKDDNRFGPFAYAEIVKMLQSKSLFEFDYVWRPGFQEWKRVAETSEFSSDSIRKLRESRAFEGAEVFFRRRHARVALGASLIVHDGKRVVRARTIEIGAGGASIRAEGVEFSIGQTLYLHFKPGEGVPPFNAKCTVVSCAQGGKDHAKYGVSFTFISQQTRQLIEDFANRKARAS